MTKKEERNIAVRYCVKALKKQMPKKPKTKKVQREVYNNGGFKEMVEVECCPCCKNEIEPCVDYCSSCGQRIDWSF